MVANMTPTTLTRKQLYDLVWQMPLKAVGDRYGATGTQVTEACVKLNVPRPPLGYWSQIRHGCAMPRPELPDADGTDADGWEVRPTVPKPRRVRSATSQNTPKPKTKVAVSAPPRRHPLLRGVEAHFRKSRSTDERDLLRPFKYLLPDIVASSARLELAIGLANQLYSALGQQGCRVIIADHNSNFGRFGFEERTDPKSKREYGEYGHGTIWCPQRPTVAYVDDMAVGITLVEMTEKVTLRYVNGRYLRETAELARSAARHHSLTTWTKSRDVPSGRMRAIIYCPTRGVEWSRSFDNLGSASDQVGVATVVKAVVEAATDFVPLIREAEIEAERLRKEREEKWLKWEMQQDAEAVRKAQETSLAAMQGIIRRWTETDAVARFFDGIEASMQDLPEDKRATFQERLAAARQLIGDADPLGHFLDWRAPEEIYTRKFPER